MAARKNEQSVSEGLPVQDSSTEGNDMMQPNEGASVKMADPGAGKTEGGQADNIREEPTGYKITCRNRVTKPICGIDFVDGEGWTDDAYMASWFAGKDGYTVEPAG